MGFYMTTLKQFLGVLNQAPAIVRYNHKDRLVLNVTGTGIEYDCAALLDSATTPSHVKDFIATAQMALESL
jgi:hypothetical protein